jgi:hypothetical protein
MIAFALAQLSAENPVNENHPFIRGEILRHYDSGWPD